MAASGPGCASTTVGAADARHANVTPNGEDGGVSTTTGSTRVASSPATGAAWRDGPAAIAGVVATLAALGVSELLAGLLPGATSLLAAVAQVIVVKQPPGA